MSDLRSSAPPGASARAYPEFGRGAKALWLWKRTNDGVDGSVETDRMGTQVQAVSGETMLGHDPSMAREGCGKVVGRMDGWRDGASGHHPWAVPSGTSRWWSAWGKANDNQIGPGTGAGAGFMGSRARRR